MCMGLEKKMIRLGLEMEYREEGKCKKYGLITLYCCGEEPVLTPKLCVCVYVLIALSLMPLSTGQASFFVSVSDTVSIFLL